MTPKRKYDPELVRAFDAMVKARPLKPPPTRFAGRTRSAGELALERDKRAGIVGDSYLYTSGGRHD